MAFADFLREPWAFDPSLHPPPGESPLALVLVEPRPLPELPLVVAQAGAMIPYASLVLFVSPQSGARLRTALGLDAHPNIAVREILDAGMTIEGYSRLLCSAAFWSDPALAAIPAGGRVLLFQADTGILENRVLRYMEYDYVGAPWPWAPIPAMPWIRVGNGGFSLRCPRVMRKICEAHTLDTRYAIQGHEERGEPEDLFFARHMHEAGASVPAFDDAAAFAVEYHPHPSPMGFHRAYEYQPDGLVRAWFAAARAARGASTDPLPVPAGAWFGSAPAGPAPAPLVAFLRLGVSGHTRRWFLPAHTRIPGAPSRHAPDILHVSFRAGAGAGAPAGEVRVPFADGRTLADAVYPPQAAFSQL